MTIQQVIEKAIEGGLEIGQNHAFIGANSYWVRFEDGNETPYSLALQVFLLDPEFWKALGKSMGWGTESIATTSNGFQVQEWQMFWHRFIDHLAEGNSIESYFESL